MVSVDGGLGGEGLKGCRKKGFFHANIVVIWRKLISFRRDVIVTNFGAFECKKVYSGGGDRGAVVVNSGNLRNV